MFFSEMRSSSNKRYLPNLGFRFILIILILLTYGEALPRQKHTDKDRELRKQFISNDMDNFRRDSEFDSKISVKVTENSHKNDVSHEVISETASHITHKRTNHKHKQLGKSFAESRSRRSSPSSNPHTGARTRVRENSELRNKNLLASDPITFRRKESFSQSENNEQQSNSQDVLKNLHEDDSEDDIDEDDTTDEPRIDLILNDMSSQKSNVFENIMDYYYVSEADESNHFGVPKHGVIINLRGLIPSKIDMDDDVNQEGLSPDEDLNNKRKSDAVLAFKAFEISSSPLSADPGKSLSEFDDQFNEEVADVKTNSNSTSLESRNLSRKRRQKASPHQDDESDRHRKGHFRRRRRKRKRRLRPSKVADSSDGKSRSNDKFLLRSNGPAYVITSANEVKKDWCKTVPFKQKITEADCRPRVIMNNFCYGQCNSFFIPHSGKSDNGAAFQSCAFCKPHKSKWTTVTLHCPGQTPSRVEKRILMVETCRCKTEILN